MKIRQVEELVGISSKNIRFYEAQGLLCPPRAENGYREYTLEHVAQLKQIKLLRKLGIPVTEIRLLLDGTESMTSVLRHRLDQLQTEQDNLASVQRFIRFVLSSGTANTAAESLPDWDIWLEEMEQTEQKGVGFLDIGKMDIHRKKKLGALLGGLFVVLASALPLIFLCWAGKSDPQFPLLIPVLLGIITAGVVTGIVMAIRSRIKEINGGEEDEAAEY